MNSPFSWMPPRISRACFFRLLLTLAIVSHSVATRASLDAYDLVINADATLGLNPLAKLTNATAFTGANRLAFNFGASSGDVTMEFLLQGNPAAIAASGYLAVGANASSNLRYEQHNNTSQLGFTQLGVLDYLFSPGVPSPMQPTHIAYVWQAATLTMKLYLNGSLAGSSSGVNAAFAMPSGQGWLGANPGGTETMVGTVHRVTVYDDVLSDGALQRHSDAYFDIARPPILVSFTATPGTIFTPASATLNWNVQNALALFIDAANVTALPGLAVTPATTTTYTLVATNAGGSVTGRVTVVVNPAPGIHSFTASKSYAAAGETITLSWNVSHGEGFSITPGVGDVTVQTFNGAGSIGIQPAATTHYTLSAGNAFGTSTAAVEILLVHPANHPVISEFVADNDSILADEDDAFSDWIEILNPTATAVNLSGYFLSDNKSDPTQWPFPNLSLASGAHLIVFASGKDRRNPAAPLHANFQLDKAGEYLALVGPGPVVLQAFDPFPAQQGDVAYGILGGDPATLRPLGVPTPGAANNDTPPPPARVEFSHASGLFTETFTLALASDTPFAAIRYTVNGSIPSATNGTVYTGPITVNGTTRVRAAALAFGQVSEVTGASYIKLAAELAGYTSSLPIMIIENFGAGTIPVKPFNSNGSGIRQATRQFAAWATFDRKNGISSLTNPPQMFNNIGIRSRGGASSQWRQKPFSVEGIDEDGAERQLSPLGLPAHADWVLYFPDADTATSKDATMLFNTFAFELSANSGRYAVRFRWVEAFLNEDGGDLRLADRRGVYAIVEKVSRGEDRLDFQGLSTDGTNGGWLLNINRMDSEPADGWPAPNGATQPWFFHTASQNRILQTADNALPVQGDDEPQQINAFINFDNPNGYTINTNQRAGIQNWFRQFEDVLWNDAIWRHPVNGYRKYVDVVDFADFFVMNVLTRNSDGLLISIFPWKGDDNKLRMGPVWDFNYNTYHISGAPTGSLLHRSDRLWYRRIFADPEFLQLYIDRWWEHRRGPMSNAAMDAILDGQSAEISAAKAVLNGMPSATEWTNRLTTMKNWLKDRANWIDGNYLRPPTLNQNGGDVPDGFQVTILGTNGAIYFTIDGSDPRAPGGAIAASAQAFQLPFTLAAQTLVQARIRNGTNWSGLTSSVFYPPQDLSKLVVTEIMYNPPAFGIASGDEVEFIELKNTGSATLQLGTLTFSTAITFTFTNGTRLLPGQFFVLARNAAVFASKYPGVTVNGIYITGKLDNGGETLHLSSPLGGTVLAVTYNDRAPWPLAADGHGFSLVPVNVLATPNSDNGAHWRASSAAGGSPGADDPAPAVAPVLIHEILTHTDLPAVDWIELFNPNATDVDLGGWFLSDDGAAPKKFRIAPGTMISAGGHRVFTEDDFNAPPGSIYSFSIDSAGDSIYLSSGDATTNLNGYSHGFAFGAAANGVTFGRYVNSVGEEQLPAQLATTREAPNSGPRIGPVVISEIHYHPDASSDEFIELRNLTGDDVPLFDLARPTHTWRMNGLGFSFPTNMVLPSNGLVLIVGTNPAAFRAKYPVPAAVLVIGPFIGALQDSGERLELQRPDAPDTNGLPYITVDEIRYNDKAPWPPAADGSGPSLQRRIASAYGNDPINWEAALPTPGTDFVPGQSPPSITSQPQNQAILSSQSAQFNITATGAATLLYQWLFNGSLLPGATNATLVLPNVQPGQAGDYSAVVFNSAGSAASAPARLTVNRKPTILEQPTNQFVRPGLGSSAVFNVSAVGNGPLRYQWQRDGTNLPNATITPLTITNVQLTHVGAYSVIVTDNVGPATSLPASLILLIDPIVVQPPLSQAVVPGATVTLSVSVTNTATLPLGYRLRRNGSTLPGAFLTLDERTAYFTLSGTNVAPPWTNYAIICTNLAKPGGNLSSAAILTFAADGDDDTLPDAWELQYFGSTNGANFIVDFDGDGMLNWQEYLAGTDPTNSLSYLKIDSIAAGPGPTLTFGALSNKTYTVQFTERLGSGIWSRLADVLARPTNRTENLVDPGFTTNRFYRLATPRLP